MESPEPAGTWPRSSLTGFAEPDVFKTGLSVELAELPDDPDLRPPFRASRFTVVPGGCTPPDTHAVAECWFVAAGSARLVYDDEKISLRPGDIVVFAPNRTHQAFNAGGDELIVFSTWWDVDDRP